MRIGFDISSRNWLRESVTLDPLRLTSQMGKISEQVIALLGLVDSEVRITLEIEANVTQGVPDNVVRIVTANGRILRFTSAGLEAE